MAIVKTMTDPDVIPARLSGSVTLRKVFQGLAPWIAAASR